MANATTKPRPAGPPAIPPGWAAVESLLCPLCERPVHVRDGGGLWAEVRCFGCDPATHGGER